MFQTKVKIYKIKLNTDTLCNNKKISISKQKI